MRQLAASWDLAIRLMATFFPFMLSPATVVSKVVRKGSCPSTQIGKESSTEDVALSGHSTNLPSLYRYAAFTSYSDGVERWPYKTGTLLSAQAMATTTVAMRKTRHGRLPVFLYAGVGLKKPVSRVCFLITVAIFATSASRSRFVAFRQDPQDLRQPRHGAVERGSVPRLTN